jgi:site-specific recombinase XerD
MLEDVQSFGRVCWSGNLSPRTIETYAEALTQLPLFLAASGMPTEVDAIRREHVEAFIADRLERLEPTTAHNRYRRSMCGYRLERVKGKVVSDQAAA